MKGVKKSQRKSVMPKPIEPPFIFAGGNQLDAGMPRSFRVEAKANATNTETMPFQKRTNSNRPNAWPIDRWVAPMTVPRPSRWNQVPAGGLLASTSVSTVVPEVRSDSRCERLQVRQN